MNITSKIIAGLALSFSLAACGGSDGSGVDGGKRLNSLSASEQQDFCEYVIEVQGGAGHTTTCGEVTVTTGTVADCVADFGDFGADCTATVANGEDCAEALGDDPCSDPGAACAAIISCVL